MIRGDHRIIYRIDEAQHRVIIEAIGHRSDIYRRGP
jgi:mRNA-degrading endonuclease RelE of RelBE toxin-antitoxin system